MLQGVQKSLLGTANLPVAAHELENTITKATSARDPLVPQDDAQEYVNTITPRHPQLVPFGEPRVSMGTSWNSSQGVSSGLFHFRGRRKRPGDKTSCIFSSFSKCSSWIVKPEGWEKIFTL